MRWTNAFAAGRGDKMVMRRMNAFATVRGDKMVMRRMNAFATMRGDKMVRQPLVTLLGHLFLKSCCIQLTGKYLCL